MSKTFRFNKTNLSALMNTKPGATVRDSQEKGLKFKVGKLRSVFLFEKRISGRTNAPPVTITIGAFPAISIEGARQEARRLSTLCEKGEDPRLVLKARETKPALLLRDAIDKFFFLKRGLRPRTLQKYRDVVKHQFPVSWMDRDITTINPELLVEQFHLARKTARERCWEFLKVFTNIWNTCKPFYKDRLGKPILEVNPIPEVRNMIKHLRKDPPIRTVIPNNALGKFVVIVEQLRRGELNIADRRPPTKVSLYVERMCNIVLISLFTAMRFSEMRFLRWEYVDLEQGFIKLPGKNENHDNDFLGTKNAHDHLIPLSVYPFALMNNLYNSRESMSPFVFPAIRTSEKPIDRHQKVFSRISELVGFHYSPHASRRTFASVANEVGLGFLEVKRLLNHAFEGGVTGGYIVPGFNPIKKRNNFQKVCDYILERRAEYLGQKKATEPGFDRVDAVLKLKRFALEIGLDLEETLKTILDEKQAVT